MAAAHHGSQPVLTREQSTGHPGGRRTGGQTGLLVGFVNVAWDGGDHAFLIDTKTRGSHQRRGIGRELVRVAVLNAAAAGCEWLFVDFGPELAPFYFDACGFTHTEAGLIHLSSASNSPATDDTTSEPH